MHGTTLLFTVGYQGRTPPQLVLRLREAGVTRVVDVRASPRSPKPGYSKGPLSRTLREAGIEYVHLGGAGNPFLEEAAADLATGLARFREHVRGRPEIVRAVLDTAAGARSALLCAEADARRCHRSVLVDAVVEMLPEVKVVHL